MSVKLNCIVCGKEFQVPPCREKTAKTCSNECAISVRAKSRERKVQKICGYCGKGFEVPRSHESRYDYCSSECRYQSPETRQKISDRMSGPKGAAWKGGETLHKDGYVWKYRKGHPYARTKGLYVFKHRLVMEEWLIEENPQSEYLIQFGDHFYLRPDIDVHHLDWDKKNNRKRNLLACLPGVHTTIHNGKMPEPGTYWPPNAKIKLGKPKGFLINIT